MWIQSFLRGLTGTLAAGSRGISPSEGSTPSPGPSLILFWSCAGGPLLLPGFRWVCGRCCLQDFIGPHNHAECPLIATRVGVMFFRFRMVSLSDLVRGGAGTDSQDRPWVERKAMTAHDCLLSTHAASRSATRSQRVLTCASAFSISAMIATFRRVSSSIDRWGAICRIFPRKNSQVASTEKNVAERLRRRDSRSCLAADRFVDFHKQNLCRHRRALREALDLWAVAP